ncbi:Arginyl-tRNA--protein transferase 1 [Dispira simplex]|nr:Arginyl-tRNA--protein transferase 1 [Dispira simplex]
MVQSVKFEGDLLPHSVVTPLDGCVTTSCGYCHRKDASATMYRMLCDYLTPEDYQDLIDRNWRRSGYLLYRRDFNTTCCPTFSIRLNIHDFHPSKQDRKTVNKLNRYLRTPAGNLAGSQGLTSARGIWRSSAVTQRYVVDQRGKPVTLPPRKFRRVDPNNLYMRMYQRFEDCIMDGSDWRHHTNIVHKLRVVTEPARFEKESFEMFLRFQNAIHHDDTSRWDQDKYALFLCMQPILSQHFDGTFVNRDSSPADELPSPSVHTRHTDCSEVSEGISLSDSPDLEQADESSPHTTKTTGMDSDQRTSPSLASTVTLSHQYGDGQQSGDTLPTVYGSYHQKYYLGSTLVAVGVIDILPSSVTSVYLFYEPEYHFLSLGRYCALREIAFTKRLRAAYPHLLGRLNYYVMGLYIHNCPKMRYKGTFHPSELLDPVTYQWRPLDEVHTTLDNGDSTSLVPISIPAHPSDLHSLTPSTIPWYQRVGTEIPATDTKQLITPLLAQTLKLPPMGFLLPCELREDVWREMLVLIGGKCYRAEDLRRVNEKCRQPLEMYYASVGHDLAKRLLVSPYQTWCSA